MTLESSAQTFSTCLCFRYGCQILWFIEDRYTDSNHPPRNSPAITCPSSGNHRNEHPSAPLSPTMINNFLFDLCSNILTDPQYKSDPPRTSTICYIQATAVTNQHFSWKVSSVQISEIWVDSLANAIKEESPPRCPRTSIWALIRSPVPDPNSNTTLPLSLC